MSTKVVPMSDNPVNTPRRLGVVSGWCRDGRRSMGPPSCALRLEEVVLAVASPSPPAKEGPRSMWRAARVDGVTKDRLPIVTPWGRFDGRERGDARAWSGVGFSDADDWKGQEGAAGRVERLMMGLREGPRPAALVLAKRSPSMEGLHFLWALPPVLLDGMDSALRAGDQGGVKMFADAAWVWCGWMTERHFEGLSSDRNSKNPERVMFLAPDPLAGFWRPATPVWDAEELAWAERLSAGAVESARRRSRRVSARPEGVFSGGAAERVMSILRGASAPGRHEREQWSNLVLWAADEGCSAEFLLEWSESSGDGALDAQGRRWVEKAVEESRRGDRRRRRLEAGQHVGGVAEIEAWARRVHGVELPSSNAAEAGAVGGKKRPPQPLEVAEALTRAGVARRRRFVAGRGWLRRDGAELSDGVWSEGGLWSFDLDGVGVSFEVQSELLKLGGRVPETARVVRELRSLLPPLGAADLDAAVGLLGSPDGRVFDLSVRRLRALEADEIVTRRLGAAPPNVERIEVPLWEGLLRLWARTDEQMNFLAWVLGRSFTGRAADRLLFFHGPGGGGKSTLLNCLVELHGEYAATLPDDAFTFVGGGRHREQFARLAGARLVTINDLAPQALSNLATLKSLVTGDPVTANFMRQGSFTFKPRCTVLIAGNQLPDMRYVDSGFERRMVRVPIPAIPAARRDPEFAHKLRLEYPMILDWLLAQAERSLRVPCPPVPAEWVMATQQFLSMDDPIGVWWDERVTVTGAAGDVVKGPALAASFNDYYGFDEKSRDRMSRVTPIYKWLLDNPVEGVELWTKGRRNYGVRGVRVAAPAPSGAGQQAMPGGV